MTLVASRNFRPGHLTGTQKAAIFCMAMGTEASSKILQHLRPEEVEAVSREIARIPVVGPEVVDSVVAEFGDVHRAASSVAQGGIEYARELLDAALGSTKAKSILERIQDQVTESGLNRLRRAGPDQLIGALRGEHPQTAALVLAHVDARLAAAVIEGLDSQLANDILYRIGRMEKVSPEVLAMVEQALSSSSDLSLSAEMTISGGPAAVARLLNNLPGGMEKSVLEAIAERESELADEIRNLMFVFEDLIRLDGRSMQRLLREVEGKTLALALKAASDELKGHIFANMAERAAGTVKEEIELMGPVRVKDVEAAHSEIVRTARELAEQNEIMLEFGSSDAIIA